MITEDYVSFETAKLLKEKGFEPPHDYRKCMPIMYTDKGEIKWGIWSDDWYPRITLQMAMKWLRETFEIHCQIDCPIGASNWEYGIRDLNEDEWLTLRDMGDYETYEESCEAAVKYCLENLI